MSNQNVKIIGNHCRVFESECSTNVPVSVTPLTCVNHDILSTQPNKEDQCDKCGQFPHPVESVRNLSAELQSAFPVPGVSNDAAAAPKRRKVQVTARYISGDDMYTQMKEKAQATSSVKPKVASKPKAICKPKTKVAPKVKNMEERHDNRSSVTSDSQETPKSIGNYTTLSIQQILTN